MSGRRWAVVIAVALLIVGGGGFLLVRFLLGNDSMSGPECVVQPDPTLSTQASTTLSLGDSATASPALRATDALSLDAVQLQYASTINAVGLRLQIPERGRVIAIATALQESSLRNVTSGDRDSVGLFQQRPSQGWGTAAQIIDPVYASRMFYERLVELDEWATLSLTDAAQAVQESAFPTAYAKWEPAATTLAGALSREWYRSVSCRDGATPPSTPAPSRSAVAGSESAVPALRELLAAADVELGGIVDLSIAAGGASATLVAEVAGLDATTAAAALSAWMVAHATSGSIESVAVANSLWSDHQWTDATSPVPDGRVSVTVAGSPSSDEPGAGY